MFLLHPSYFLYVRKYHSSSHFRKSSYEFHERICNIVTQNWISKKTLLIRIRWLSFNPSTSWSQIAWCRYLKLLIITAVSLRRSLQFFPCFMIWMTNLNSSLTLQLSTKMNLYMFPKEVDWHVTCEARILRKLDLQSLVDFIIRPVDTRQMIWLFMLQRVRFLDVS